MSFEREKKQLLTENLQKQVDSFINAKCSSQSSKRIYRAIITKFLASGLSGVDWLASTNYAPSTRNSYAGILDSWFNFLGSSEHVSAPYRPAKRIGNKDAFRPDEIAKLLAEAERTDLRLMAVILLACKRGFRASDIVALRWSMIDSEGRVTIVRKGMKEQQFKLSGEILEALERVRVEDNDYCIPNRRGGGGGITVEAMTHAFRKIQRACDLDSAALSLHSLRHSYACALMDKGVPVLNIQHCLGHSQIETTYIYLQTIARTTETEEADALLDS